MPTAPALQERFRRPNADSGAYNNSKGTYTTSPYPYIVTPAPDSWTNHPAPGWTATSGPSIKGSPTWRPRPTQPISDFAATVQELLTGSNTAWSNSTKSTAGTPKTWDNDGYDLNPNTGGYQTGYVPGTPSTSTFKGYTMGPGYYGKTFYIWPPDPRTPVSSPGNASYLPGDWRQRYFGTSDNSVLWNSSGIWQSAGTVNYNAILAWINSGPQVLPPNLMAGKVIYYSSIPTSIPSSGLSLDQLFWKNYIDFVLGYNLYGPTTTLYGQASSNSSGGNTYAPAVGSAIKITAQSSLTGSPRPYMSYNDIPVHPRLAFWFGPLTMMAFLTGPPEYSQNWLPGTAHEAHAWHLKAGIQSAIQDIKNNHPNDYAALIYFSTLSQYNNARVPLGQNYTYMTNALFYPYSLINSTTGAVSGTMRPYDTNWNDLSQGVIPNSMGGTNPTGAFMTAYNEFQNNGRIGAAKLVIYETDGVTHDYYSVNSNYNSYTSNFTFGSNIDEPVSTTFTQSKTESIKMAGILCNPISGAVSRTISNPDFSVTVPAYNGFSTTRSPVSIHAIGFGELFEPYLTTMETQTGQPANAMQQTALKCMLYVQQASGTSAQTDTIGSCWGYPGTPTVPGSPGPPIVLGTGGYTTGSQSFKIIVGDYNTRVSLIQQALQRIMQSGVQVGLIQ